MTGLGKYIGIRVIALGSPAVFTEDLLPPVVSCDPLRASAGLCGLMRAPWSRD